MFSTPSRNRAGHAESPAERGFLAMARRGLEPPPGYPGPGPGTTSSYVAGTEQDLKDAQKAAKTPEEQAAAAKQDAANAKSATDKANAKAKQAQEDAKAAQAQTKVVTDCANAYLTAVGSVAESDDPSSAAAAAKKDLQSIAPDCKAALGGG